MYIIVGLGNPGKEYKNTRHNIGFRAIDYLAEKYVIDISNIKHKAKVGKGLVEGQKVILIKPQTFMNLSGESIHSAIDFYKEDEKTNLIILYDDVSLEVGQLRIRKKGSAGGHNGIKSIISHLGHDTFIRIKIGVGEKPSGYDLADYVLGHFTKDENVIMEDSLDSATKAIVSIITQGPDYAMNLYNKKM